MAILLFAGACGREGNSGQVDTTATGSSPAAQSRASSVPRASSQPQTRLLKGIGFLDSAFAALPGRLRADSGSARADSILLVTRSDLNARVRALPILNDSVTQLLIWPDGYRAQQLRRAKGLSVDSVSAEEKAVADSLRQLLESHGLHATNAEGDTYFAVSDARLLSEARPFITQGLRDYLALAARDQTVPYAGDAAVTIPWDSLAARIAEADRQLAAAVNPVVQSMVRRQRDNYLFVYLGGADNTRGFERTGRLQADVQRSYEQFVAQHGQSYSGAVVRDYLAILRKHDYRNSPELQQFRLNVLK